MTRLDLKYIILLFCALVLTACSAGAETGRAATSEDSASLAPQEVAARRGATSEDSASLAPQEVGRRRGAHHYTDPFLYCSAVQNIDQPDSRYIGPKVPIAVARGLQRAFGTPADRPLEPFLQNSYWRCMGGKVYACNIGANIPCLAKANTDREPTVAMSDYCKANPSTTVLPAYVSGRESIYAWGCANGKAVIVGQVTEPDARGFLARFWHHIEPS